MKIGFIGMYYYPEKFSSRYQITDIINFLRENKNEVTLIVPNPVRTLTKEEILKYKNFKEEGIVRLWCGSNNRNSKLARISRIFKFNSKLKKYLKNNHDFDVLIMQSNPPIFSPKVVEKCAKKYGIKTVFYVDDIFPDVMNKNGLIYSVLKKESKRTYLNADYLVTVSEDVKNTLVGKGVKEDKITIIRPWPFDQEKCEKQTFNFDKETFNVAYIGNIGEFQNCKYILDISKEITNDKIMLYIIGSGREEKRIRNIIDKENLKNVKFVDRVSEAEARVLYTQSDLNLIVLNKNVVKFATPSKTANCVLSGKPCLLLCDKSEYSNELVNKYHFYFDDSFNSKKVADLINNIYENYDIKRFENNKEVEEFNKNSQLSKWKELLEVL